jgi:ankyrin repeat protein
MKKSIITTFVVVFAMASSLMASEVKNEVSSYDAELFVEVNVSSFCKAVIQGDIKTVNRLIALGENVNQKSLGMTPAMYAARYNKFEILSILIEHGANLKMLSNQGFSVKQYAEFSNATEALAIIETALGS